MKLSSLKHKLKNKQKIIFVLILFVLFASMVLALDLPPGILKIQEANNQLASSYLSTITIAIAFLAGISSIFAPCILPLLPAYFSFTFKEKINITKMTTIFFLGFSLGFILLGLLSATIFKAAIGSLQNDFSIIIRIFGLLIISLGFMSLFNISLPILRIHKSIDENILGIFVYGIIFSLGWSACLGPVLAGILLMTSVFNNYLTTIYLMFFYSLGVFLPLLLLSLFFDKTKILRSKILQKEIKIREFRCHLSNFFAGILFIVVGLVFLIFGNTSIFNSVNNFNLDKYFYSTQNYLIANSSKFQVIGVVIILLLILLFYWLYGRKNDKN